MFRTVWSKTLREYRIPLWSWGLGLGLMMLGTFAAYGPGSNTQTDNTLTQLTQSFNFMGDPVAVQTTAGYVTFKVLDLFFPVMLCIWTILAGGNLIRGAEERNSAELLLATSISRTRLLSEKLLALASTLIVISLLIGVGTILGEASRGLPVDAWNAFLTGLNVSLLSFFFATLTVFFSQLLSNRGSAQGWAFGLLTLSVLLDGTARTLSQVQWIRYLSPNYYYGINKPLIAGYANNPWAAVVLVVGSILLSAASLWLFVRRDIGAGSFQLAGRNVRQVSQSKHNTISIHTQHDLSLRSLSLRTLRSQALPIACWLIGIIIYAGWVIELVPSFLKPIHDVLTANPNLAQLFNGHSLDTNDGFINYAVFAFVPLLLVMFVFTLAFKWAKDFEAGRMELIMSTPQTRRRLLSEHSLTIAAIALVSAVLVWLSTLLIANLINVQVDNNKLIAASFGIVPLELIIIASVYAGAARLRANIILIIVSLYLTLAYLIEFMRSLLHLPEWIMSLSIFHAYGSPLVDGWHWTPNLIMLGIAVILFALGLIQFQGSDIERGS
ncbi:ABC transporter permease subunit [Dictyobacter arantiisoli]|uniref:ABC transporter permease n=1 Tax=Dictyobacter arantiisoli TaxID=2014874 RepID=A0A5A5TKA3_9CHLR|nr:ABC transporter permease subunit [Dictyobacter arantiisoli]GCF11453.1 hypothetical protein KDI_50170 [Dictyobacter arantiisoli]